jgi:hypothetical protein
MLYNLQRLLLRGEDEEKERARINSAHPYNAEQGCNVEHICKILLSKHAMCFLYILSSW